MPEPENLQAFLFCAWELLKNPCTCFYYWKVNDKARWNLYAEGAD